jgi:hypothetical protein
MNATSFQPRVAQGLENALFILLVEQFDGTTCLKVRCTGFEHFMQLPAAVMYDDRIFGKTGWNSDRGEAYYRDDQKVAFVPVGIRHSA